MIPKFTIFYKLCNSYSVFFDMTLIFIELLKKNGNRSVKIIKIDFLFKIFHFSF